VPHSIEDIYQDGKENEHVTVKRSPLLDTTGNCLIIRIRGVGPFSSSTKSLLARKAFLVNGLRAAGASRSQVSSRGDTKNPAMLGPASTSDHTARDACYSNGRPLDPGSFPAKLVSVAHGISAKRESVPSHSGANILRFCRYVRDAGYCLPPFVQTRYSPPVR
jgi:hypothetical protein